MLEFRYNPWPFLANLRRVLLWLGVLIFAATVIGQLRADRFPAWGDLAIAASLPLGAFAVMALLVFLGCRYYTVGIDAEGIRSQNPFGFTMKMGWDDIVYAELVYKYGIPYLLLRGRQHLTPLMVSTWLRNPEGFAAAVRQQADTDNPLRLLLDDLEA